MIEKFCTTCYYTVMYAEENGYYMSESYKAEGIWAPQNEPEESDDFQCEGCGEYFLSSTSWLCAKIG